MTYASIEQAWGSTSGSHMLNTTVPNSRMANSIHPVHQQRINNIENFSNTGTAGNMRQRYQTNAGQMINPNPQQPQQQAQMNRHQPNFQTNVNIPGTPPGNPNQPAYGFNQPQQQGIPYNCNYGDMSCAQAVQNNTQFNNMQKMVAAGMQPFTPWSPQPQNYKFAGQYPWYPWAKQGFLNYGNDISSMWYNQPWMFYPDIARQVQNYQANHPGDYRVPIERPYQPPSYGNLYEQGNSWPRHFAANFNSQDTYPTHRRRSRRREAFGDLDLGSDSNLVRNCLVIFTFFLLAVATLLVTFVIAMKAKE